MAMELASKLPEVSTTIFTVMSALAKEEDAINLSQGFPDFDVDAGLLAAYSRALLNGNNQYAPMPGLPDLRQAIATKQWISHRSQYDWESEITVTAGATQAIYTALTALVRTGDEVILFAPAYDCYAPAIVLQGGQPVYAYLRAPDFRIDWTEVSRLVTPKTRAIIVNSPHNPTGTVMKASDWEALSALCERHGLFVISDEVYEHITFNSAHISAGSIDALKERSFVVGSFGKTFHATGWKAGYCLAPAQLTTEFRKVHQYLVFSVNTPMQYALAEFLADSEHYLHVPDLYKQKRDYFLSLMRNSPWEFTPCEGSYFQLAGYGAFDQRPDVEFSKWLTRTHKVAVIPISVFYPDGYDARFVRFCFAKKEETLLEASKNLKLLNL